MFSTKGAPVDDEFRLHLTSINPLAEGAPPFSRRERCTEIFGLDDGTESHHSGGTIIFKTTCREKHSVRRHGPCIVIRTLDFVVRIPLFRTIAVMDRTGHGQTLHDQFRSTFSHHMGSGLIFKPPLGQVHMINAESPVHA